MPPSRGPAGRQRGGAEPADTRNTHAGLIPRLTNRLTHVTATPIPLTVLVDDVRSFRDERPARVARSSKDALKLLKELGDTRIDHPWLDHDLVGDDTIRPVVEHLVQQARTGSPLSVGLIHIHSSNVGGGHWMGDQLVKAGYPVIHSYALAMWTREGR